MYRVAHSPCAAGVYTTAQIRERIAAALAVMDLPDGTVASFVADVQQRADRDTICASTGSMLQYFSAWRAAQQRTWPCGGVSGCRHVRCCECWLRYAAASATPDAPRGKTYMVVGGVSTAVPVRCPPFPVCCDFALIPCAHAAACNCGRHVRCRPPPGVPCRGSCCLHVPVSSAAVVASY